MVHLHSKPFDHFPPSITGTQPRNGAQESPAESNQRRKGRWGFAPQMQHAPNAACPKCSMPQMQHAPFRHVRVAYPRIISAPVSARIKCTNSSGNNQTMSRGEKELSDGVAGWRLQRISTRNARFRVSGSARFSVHFLPTKVGAPSISPLPLGEGTGVRALPKVVAPSVLGAHTLVCISCRRKSALPAIANESRRSQFGANRLVAHPVGAIRRVAITRTRRGDLLVVPTHLRQCLLLSFADESCRSQLGHMQFAGSTRCSVHLLGAHTLVCISLPTEVGAPSNYRRKPALPVGADCCGYFLCSNAGCCRTNRGCPHRISV